MSIIHFCSVVSATVDVNQSMVSLTNAAVLGNLDVSAGTGTAYAFYQLFNDGRAEGASNDQPAYPINATDWWTAKPETDIGLLYEVYVTYTALTGNATVYGTYNTWLQLNFSETWRASITGSNVELDDIITLSVQIRDIATQTVQDSATILLDVSIFGP